MADKSDLIDQLRIDRTDSESSSGKRWVTLVVLVVLVAGSYGGWRYWQLRGIPIVNVISPEPVTLSASNRRASVLDASGYVVARRQATVSSEVTGKLAEVLIEEGMRVEEGQVLARLDSTTERAQLELAEAQLAAAQSALEELQVLAEDASRTEQRQVDLKGKGLTSQALVDDAIAQRKALEARLHARRSDVEVARKRADLQRQLLEELTVRAPFSGVVVAKAAQPGEMVSPVSAGGGFTRTGIGTIVDMDSLEIEVDVSEAYIDRVDSAQPATAILDAYPDWSIPAQVIAIVPTADRQKATVRVRVGLLESDRRILPDMGVKVRFLEDEEPVAQTTTQQGWTLPSAAVDGTHAFVVTADETVERRALRIGERRSNEVVVLGGVSGSDRVVSPVPEKLASGDTVRVAGS